MLSGISMLCGRTVALKQSYVSLMNFSAVSYKSLNSKQQEIYNFQKVAGALADFGFNCIKLADDWLGADFLAYHKDGADTLKVQLKGRLTIGKKYMGKGLHIAFPINGSWCVVDHDTLITIVGKTTKWLETPSWTTDGQYHSAKPSQALIKALAPYTLRRPRVFIELFCPEPEQWGLRGDPYLWREMAFHLAATPLPDTCDEASGVLSAAFQEITGHPVSHSDDFFCPQFDNGGMSSGMISVAFWRGSALPMLLRRFSGET